MSAPTTSSARLALFCFLVFGLNVVALACGGKSQRAPIRTPVPPPAPSSPAPDASAPPVAAPPASGVLDRLAPEPKIRVGLATSAELVRLTSSRPFRVGAGSLWISTQDVLVERVESAASIEGAVFRVSLGSFVTESAAAEFRSRIASELSDPLVTRREPGTGRFEVRLGAFATETFARTRQRELANEGFEDTQVHPEPESSPAVSAISLLAAGREPLVIPALQIWGIPEEGGGLIEVEGSPYRGYVEIAVNRSSRFTVTNVLNLEAYLRGVVPSELSPEAFPEKEALKAQAVAARTYAVKRRGEFAAEGYDICATPACQVYRGVSVERRLSDEAVAETAGEVLTYEGEPVDALYTSTCGGRTENAENVFSAKKPYLVSRACFLEGRTSEIVSKNEGSKSLAEAALVRLGIVAEEGGSAAPGYGDAKRWTQSALDRLGQKGCFASPDARVLDVVALARLLSEALCWERRIPFLLSPTDAARLVGDDVPESGRLALAFAVQEGLIAPDARGLSPGAPLDRAALVDVLFRLLEKRGEPPLREGTVKRADSERLVLVDSTLSDEENELSMSLAPTRYLFRSASGSTYYAQRLSLLPNDRVRFHASADGIDLLVLVEDGGSFDRTSRFSRWVVRKSAEDLTREVNLQSPVGSVLELRPKRYGASGRLSELEIQGSASSVTLRGLAIRRALGIRENLFFLDRQRRADGTVEAWVFTGRGWGHGVGLCQVGAYGMAAAGFDYRSILEHYYVGTTISPAETRTY
jgi:stage II sporulation protein D